MSPQLLAQAATASMEKHLYVRSRAYGKAATLTDQPYRPFAGVGFLIIRYNGHSKGVHPVSSVFGHIERALKGIINAIGGRHVPHEILALQLKTQMKDLPGFEFSVEECFSLRNMAQVTYGP